jgi:hypothetical protein
MSANIAHELHGEREKERVATAASSARARIVLAMGPATVAAGVVWAFIQPWRLTLLNPHGQGFWWLFAEPPLYVVLVGVLFRVLIARPLVQDMEDAGR